MHNEEHTDEHTECIKSVSELQKEWKEAKDERIRDSNKLNWALVGLFVSVLGYAVWVGNIDTTVRYHDEQIKSTVVKVEALERSASVIQVDIASIKAQLVSMAATLIEIKQAVK